ncbi:hemicentin-1-like [Pocillopora verrucosa]|uniref:hemicentin-1-like n=1 Tax=Pocillopora verrucosa TaxID=203993 RepID=UPI00333EF809
MMKGVAQLIIFSILFVFSAEACSPPGESIKATSGHISSPNFPNNFDVNRNCTWNITVPGGKIIKLIFLKFTLVAGENDDCAGAAAESARVFITNVASHGGNPDDFKICGQKLPPPVYSEGNFIQVRFQSGTGLVNKGFNASFEAIDGDPLCPTDMILDEASGSFSSPFNPRNYPFNQTCSWNITGKQGYHVELTIPDYNMERCGGAACSCDYMEIQNSFSDEALPGKLCGTPRNVPVKFYSLHESLRVLFVSDDANMDYEGFGATYKLLNYSPPICPKKAIPLSGSGKISSTNYPKSNYTASRNCTWKITAPAHKIVKFTFTDFVLSECLANLCSDSCAYVELYDGGSTSSPLLGRFCQGSSWSETQWSNGNQMFVMFHPGQTVDRGFEAKYESTTTDEPEVAIDGNQEQFIAKGESFTLICRYNASPPVSEVQWIKDGNVITINATVTNNGSRVTNIFYNESLSQLSITSASSQDSGNYTCNVTNNVTDTTDSTSIVIQEKPSTKLQPETVTVKEGENDTLFCNSSGSSLTITWKFNGIDVTTSRDSRISFSDGNRHLIITNVSRVNKGEYKCVASNKVGNDTSNTAFVLVEFGPEISEPPTNRTKEEKQTVDFSCVVAGYPTPDVVWTKNRLELNVKGDVRLSVSSNDGDHQLNISNVQQSDAGQYRCVANNSLDTATSSSATLTVQFAPEVTIDGDQKRYLANGTDLLLTCQFNALPTVSEVQWVKDGIVIASTLITPPNGSRVTISHHNESQTQLSIIAVSLEDAGNYTCNVTNNVGSSSSNWTSIVIQVIPSIEQDPKASPVKERENLTLFCNASGSSLRISWKKNGSGINPSEDSRILLSRDNVQLTIVNVSRKDNGAYQCVASNEVGSATSNAAIVNVQLTPAIETHPQADLVKEGENLTLFCNATGSSLTISWTKNGSAINSDEDVWMRFSTDNEQLAITNVSRKDNGAYRCVASNNVGNATSNAAIVTVRFAPEISESPRDTTEVEGQTAVFNCVVGGYPTPDVAWEKDGVELNVAAHARLSVSFNNGNRQLIITNVQQSDAGQYRCVANNSLDTVTSSPATLTVHYEPEVAIDGNQEQFIAKGESFTLICRYNASPPVSEVQWIKDGNVITINATVTNGSRVTNIFYNESLSQLSITSASSQDSAVYICNVTNNVNDTTDSTSIVIQEKPSTKLQPKTLTVKEGENVTLFCNSSGSPLTITWKFNGSDVTTSGDSRIGFSHDNRHLIITNVSRVNKGEYKCVASNKVGNDTSNTTFVLVEFGPEISEPPTNRTKEEKQTVDFSCVVAGYPTPDVVWTKNRMELNVTGDMRLSVSSNDGDHQLTISNVQQSDAGQYRCVANNSLDTATSSSATLTVQFAPEVTIDGDQKRYLANGTDLLLTCQFNALPTVSEVQWVKDGIVIASTLITPPNGSRVTISHHNESQTQLSIIAVSLEDAGNYTCNVTNNVGSSSSNWTSIVIQVIPSIEQDPKASPVKERENLTLFCNASGSSLRISWKKNGSGINPSEDSRILLSRDNVQLTIVNVSRKDNGAYQCVASNEVGSATSNAAIVNVQFGPEISEPPIDTTKIEGQTVVLSCLVAGYPTPAVAWTKNDVELNSIANLRLNVSSKNGNHTLKITDVQKSDAGQYRCVANNSLQTSKSSPSTLTVQFAPEVTIDGDQIHYVANSTDLQLTCRFHALPPASEVQWLNNGNVIASTLTVPSNGSRATISHHNESQAQLLITTVSLEDAGNYTCNVTNVVGSSSNGTLIIFQVTPAIETHPQADPVKEGENLTFFCNATGSSLTISWTKNGSSINPNEDVRIRLSTDKEHLTIRNVSRKDNGAYRCVASNKVGNATSNAAIVTVRFAPEISQSPRDTTEVEGQTAEFNCVVAGYPKPDVAWEKMEWN